MVTRGWNGYRNKSQHRKSTLEKKILPPFQQGFEPETFQSRVRCSNHRAIPAPQDSVVVGRFYMLSSRLTGLLLYAILNEWLYLFIARFWISTKVVYLQRCLFTKPSHQPNALPLDQTGLLELTFVIGSLLNTWSRPEYRWYSFACFPCTSRVETHRKGWKWTLILLGQHETCSNFLGKPFRLPVSPLL